MTDLIVFLFGLFAGLVLALIGGWALLAYSNRYGAAQRVRQEGVQERDRRRKERSVPYWLENAKELDECGDDIQAMDLVFDKVDNLLFRGDFSSVNNLLRAIDVSRYSEDLLLTILTATLAAKDKLQERGAYFQQVHMALTHRGIDADRVLIGLS